MSMMTGYVNLFVSLFVITNPIGNLPIFIGLTKDYDAKRRRHAALITFVASLVIMLIAEWAGEPLLNFFGISLDAFTLGGGFVIFMIGYSMLQSKTSEMQHTTEEHALARAKEGSIAVVPMSIPLIAGPGTMSTIILIAHMHHSVSRHVGDSVVIFVLMLAICILLLLSNVISRVLGPAGVKIVTRIMGLILMAIAVGMMARGAVGLFPILKAVTP